MDSAAPVFDPDIPARYLRRSAAAAKDKVLVAFGAGRTDLDKARGRLGVPVAGSVLSACFAAALLVPAGIVLSGYPPVSEPGVTLGVVGLILGCGAVSAFFQLVRSWEAITLAVRFHRRYVLPASDFDPRAGALWDRAVRASNVIEEARVVREGRIDTARLSEVLPRWRWEIAGALARLSAVRTAQRALLAGAGEEAPEVAALARPQQQAQDLAEAGIERRLRDLEDFARQVAGAEAALGKVRALIGLPALDDLHLDLLARAGVPEAGQDIAGQDLRDMTAELPAVIAEAAEALRAVSATARALAVPGGTADGTAPDAAGR